MTMWRIIRCYTVQHDMTRYDTLYIEPKYPYQIALHVRMHTHVRPSNDNLEHGCKWPFKRSRPVQQSRDRLRVCLPWVPPPGCCLALLPAKAACTAQVLVAASQ